MQTFKLLLFEHNACSAAKEWAGNKTFKEVFNTCDRGDWLIWLYQKTMHHTEKNDRQFLLTKAHCANTVRYINDNELTNNIIDSAIAYGTGVSDATDFQINLNRVKLHTFRSIAELGYNIPPMYIFWAADAISNVGPGASANAATYSSYVSRHNTDHNMVDIVMKENLKLTADIIRKYLPIEFWDIAM